MKRDFCAHINQTPKNPLPIYQDAALIKVLFREAKLCTLCFDYPVVNLKSPVWDFGGPSHEIEAELNTRFMYSMLMRIITFKIDVNLMLWLV